MSIVKKTIIMIVIVTILLFSLVYLISNFMYIRGFEDLENQAVRQNIERAVDALSARETVIKRLCVDWAEWDDTYYFLMDFNQEYIDRNLMDGTFIDGDINVFLFIDTHGELVYGKSLSPANMQEVELPDDTTFYLKNTVMPNAAASETGFTGITLYGGLPMLTACTPVLTSTGEGPSTGYLIVGRFIDDQLTGYFTQTMGTSIEFLPLQEGGQSPEPGEIAETAFKTGNVFIQIQPDNNISGYQLINDISGNPAFVFKITIPRDIYSEAMKTIAYLHSSLLGIAIVFCAGFVLLFRRLILTRLTTLSNAVNSIGVKGEISNRVHVKGSDELSSLAGNINNMLDSLEKSELRRQTQKEIIGHITTMTPNGIIALNESGQVVIINDAFRDMFNLNNHNMFGVTLEELPDMSDIAVEINNFRLSRMPSFKKELARVRNGVNKIYIAYFSRLKEEEIYILYLTDISEERLKQESMYLTDRLASIGEMASGIAHELNNPLTSIIGLSEIVMRDEVPESVKEDMDLIKSESHRAAGIVRNLLSFARKNATLKQAANINKIVSDVLKLRSYEHGVNNIKIEKDLSPDLPDIMVDFSQIQQVFINIILNAEHAMTNAHGKGTLKIKTETIKDMLRVSVADDGLGIEPGNLRHIFDPFFTTKEVGKGTGLGLSICYGIVTAHNGRIYAMSEFGKGATFIIDLPLHSAGTNDTRPAAA